MSAKEDVDASFVSFVARVFPLGCGLSGSLSVCFYLLHVPLWVLAIINKAIIANESVHLPKLFETNGSRLAELLVNIFAFNCVGPR